MTEHYDEQAATLHEDIRGQLSPGDRAERGQRIFREVIAAALRTAAQDAARAERARYDALLEACLKAQRVLAYPTAQKPETLKAAYVACRAATTAARRAAPAGAAAMTDDHDAHAASLVRSAMHLAPTEPLTGTAQRLAALIAADRRAAVAAERSHWFDLLLMAVAKNNGPRSAWNWLDAEVTRLYGEAYTGEPEDAAQSTPDAAGPADGQR